MERLPFLEDFVIILLAAVLIILVSRPLRLPSVVGFLLTGILIGPFGLNIVANRSVIEAIAELGIVMLLFVVGLEFSLSHLRSMWRQFFIAGGLQVTVTIAVVFLLSAVGGFSQNERIFFGCLVALSSTAIVIKLLADRGELDTPHGKLTIGILLFQDFCIVPMIVFTPLLSGASGVLGDILIRFGLSILAVVAVFYISRVLLSRVLEHILRSRVREAFLLFSLLACLLLSVATASLGFSYALGAFIAGLIVAETQYKVAVVAEIVPFRDLFTSLFFISVGMLLDRSFVLDNLPSIFGLGIGILLVKGLIISAIALSLKYSPRYAIISAIGLAQVGEFSFVLAQVGQSTGILQESISQHFLGASILTMLVSPSLIALAPTLAERTQRFMRLASLNQETHKGERPAHEDHVIIVGFGLNGRNLSRVLKETGIPYVVVETDTESIHNLRREGHPVIFGDVTRKEVLERCGIDHARVIVFAISDPSGTQTAVRLARSMNSSLHIIVRTRLVAHVDELTRFGANEVIPEEFETSIEIFTRVLDHYHIPRNVVHAQIQVIRDENYGMLRGVPQTAKGLDRVARLLTAGTSDIFLVTESTGAAGLSLSQLGLSEKTGASLIAVVRNEKPFITPAGDFVIQPGDTLVLVGNHANMDKAFDYLSSERKPDHEDS